MRVFLLCWILCAATAGGEGDERYAPFADPTFPLFGLSADASPKDAPRSNGVPRDVVVRVPKRYLPDLAPADQVELGYFGGRSLFFTPRELAPLDLARFGFDSIDLHSEAAAARAVASATTEEPATPEHGRQRSQIPQRRARPRR